MEMTKFFNEFTFLGYDIRRVKETHFCTEKVLKKVFSIDQAISERLDNYIDDRNKKNNEFQMIPGLYPSYQKAKNDFEKIKTNDSKNSIEIIALFIYKESFNTAVKMGYLEDESAIAIDKCVISHISKCEGYDVATLEYEWISFLTNCGKCVECYVNSISINDVYLIKSLEKAKELKVKADGEIPEHSPFGIWSIWSTV